MCRMHIGILNFTLIKSAYPQVTPNVTYAEMAKRPNRNWTSRHAYHGNHNFNFQRIPITDPSHYFWTGNSTQIDTVIPLPTTEAPRNNFNEHPEALSSINFFFLYFMLPACISAAVTGVILYMFLLIRKYMRSRPQAAIDKNTTGNEIIYADLELEGTNNFQRGRTEESPYAQIQITQVAQK
ncbi:uncharacterized protein LOC118280264 isoform X1 [Spodoptera frugiperda]|uniref:Uncharacterized protein LOC118280264 isoform X1 n=1 Tax=Spodoptera frugiperda TaxID=7108 RepID=A0A9R0ESL0_SPOFR|nr:uncharacterized protein LOC118280264 isoform X1 [Spodoptera frugiperda]